MASVNENTASTAAVNGVGESNAQKLREMHSKAPHVTIEDVPDEDGPKPSNSLNSVSMASPASATTVADLTKTANSSSAPDTQSHELFPELGASKAKGTTLAPVWGAKQQVSDKSKTNGTASAAASRSSTPASAAATVSRGSTPSMSIPGRNVESVTLEPQYIIPRGQLKRPIPDIVKDINRKSRANITMATASNGRLRFDATGPQDVAQQALKDLVQQIGTRVSHIGISISILLRQPFSPMLILLVRPRFEYPSHILLGLRSLERAAPPSRPCRPRQVPRFSFPEWRIVKASRMTKMP